MLLTQHAQQVEDTYELLALALGEEATADLFRRSLFFVWIGSNDFINYYMRNVSCVQMRYLPWEFNLEAPWCPQTGSCEGLSCQSFGLLPEGPKGPKTPRRWYLGGGSQRRMKAYVGILGHWLRAKIPRTTEASNKNKAGSTGWPTSPMESKSKGGLLHVQTRM